MNDNHYADKPMGIFDDFEGMDSGIDTTPRKAMPTTSGKPETPTPAQIAAARAIVEAADASLYFPKGTHVIESFVGHGTPRILLNTEQAKREYYRELTPAELDLLRMIPEIAKALEAK